jgi:hypothetical protein
MEIDAPNPPRRVRTVQRPMYYINEVLHEAKTRYLEVNKLLYAVLIASRKLRHYFQDHKISVVSSFPLRAVLHNPNATDNIAKWAAELAEFELDFVPHHAVKSQVLADFIVDWTPPANHPEGPRCSAPEPRALALTGSHWTLFFDGSSRGQGAGAGVLHLRVPVGNPALIGLDLPLTALIGVTGRRKILTCTQINKNNKSKSLSDYAQQDLSVMTRMPRILDMQCFK